MPVRLAGLISRQPIVTISRFDALSSEETAVLDYRKISTTDYQPTIGRQVV